MKKIYLLLFSLLLISSAKAQYTDLVNFNNTSSPYGANPEGSLTPYDGLLYGLSQLGGTHGYGCIFSMHTDGSGYTDLFDFNSTNGAQPNGSLTISNGVMYGMTSVGGASGYGSIFSIHTDGSSYTKLLDFNYSNGQYPGGSLTLIGNVLYGMAQNGGGNYGLLFSIHTDGSNYTNIYSFNGTPDGANPQGSLTRIRDKFYGMTEYGGANNYGSIFSIDTNGSNSSYEVLFSFNNTNGANPFGEVSLSKNKFYGMTSQGGANSYGNIFSIDTNGGGYKDLFDFNGSNGSNPLGDVSIYENKLYGMARNGGSNGYGTLFSIDTNGTSYNDLVDFNNTSVPKGSFPDGSLILYNGSLYGMNNAGGSYTNGMAFSYFLYSCTLSVSTRVIDIDCYGGNDGSVSAVNSGGTSPYTYEWSNGGTTSTISGLTVGIYSITMTDKNGCTSIASATVTQPSAIILSIAASSTVICEGSFDTLTASGASSYVWNTSASTSTIVVSPTVTTSYTVTGTTAGCSIVTTQTITVKPTPVVNADSNLMLIVAGDTTLHATGGVSPYTFIWSPPITSSILISPPTSPVIYTLTATGANGCSSSDTATLNPSAPVNGIAGEGPKAGACNSIFISGYVQDTADNNDAIEIYNPSKGTINLSGYYLEGTVNGSIASTFRIPLKGTITRYKTFMIANRHADTALTNHASQLSDSLHFNGKDVVALGYASSNGTSAILTLLDKVGDLTIPYTDSGWTVGTGSTKNHTLLRQQTVTEGDLNWSTCATEWNVQPQGSFTNLNSYSNVCTPKDPDIYYTLANPTVSCGEPSYFEFDIMVQADSAKKFNSGSVRIKYPASEFAGDVVPNNIFVTSGPNFPYIPAENDYFLVVSPSDTALQLDIGSYADNSPQGTVVDTVPQVLLHVKLQITNSCQTGTVGFYDTASYFYLSYYVQEDSTFNHIDSVKSSYTTCCPYECGDTLGPAHLCNTYCCGLDSNGNCDSTCYDTCYTYPVYCYDTTWTYIHDSVYTYNSYHNEEYSGMSFSGTLNTMSCGIKMDSITKPINAGTNAKSVSPDPSKIPPNSSIIYITGMGFGSHKGFVQVTDANQGASLYVDDTDIFIWSENLIKVKMPSVMFGQPLLTPGTGPVQVTNTCGENSNYDTLHINYNIKNDKILSPNQEKARPEIVMVNSSESFNFVCDTSVTHNHSAFACVKKAIREWNCYTGVNWKLSTDTNIKLATSTPDGISDIYFSNSMVNANDIAETANWYLTDTCYDPYDSIAFTDEADINIKRNSLPNSQVWNYDTDGVIASSSYAYFYLAILHELGHAIGLNHSNDQSSLMFFKQSIGQTLSITSGSTDPGPGTLLGALDMIRTSVLPSNAPSSLSGSCAFTRLDTIRRGCDDATLSVPDISQNLYNLNLYPNPIHSGDLMITYDLTQDSYIQFKIIDCTGRLIMKLNDEHKTEGHYTEQLNIDALVGGVYLFVATINGEFQVIKFIKI